MAVPLRVIALEGGPLTLGLLPAVFATVYVFASLYFGRLSDRGGRLRFVRLGAVLMSLGAVLLWFAPGIAGIFLLLPVFSIGRGLFWPAFQAELSDRGLSSQLGRRAGWFNVAWSSGKMLGFWTAGHIAEAYGAASPLLLAAALGLIILPLVPRDRGPLVREEVVDDEEIRRAVDRKRFRLTAWTANFIGFGVAATLNYQFPKLFLSLGFGEGDLGDFLGLVMFVQTLTFAGLGLRRGWEYRVAWVVLPMLAGAVSVLGLFGAQAEVAFLLCAPGLGFFFGVVYSQSLYHSLHQEAGPGKNAGIHEALLGAGSFLLPLAGGGAARLWGLAAPYALCAVVTAVGVGLALRWLKRPRGRSPCTP
jgi:MFS family permease